MVDFDSVAIPTNSIETGSTEQRAAVARAVRTAMGVSVEQAPARLESSRALVDELTSVAEQARKARSWLELTPPIECRVVPNVMDYVQNQGMTSKDAMAKWTAEKKKKENATRYMSSKEQFPQGKTLREVITQIPQYEEYKKNPENLDAVRALQLQIARVINYYPFDIAPFLSKWDDSNPQKVWENEGQSNCIGKLMIFASVCEELGMSTENMEIIITGFHASLLLNNEERTNIVDYLDDRVLSFIDVPLGGATLKSMMHSRSVYRAVEAQRGCTLIRPPTMKGEEQSICLSLESGLARAEMGHLAAQRTGTLSSDERLTLTQSLVETYPSGASDYLEGQLRDAQKMANSPQA